MPDATAEPHDRPGWRRRALVLLLVPMAVAGAQQPVRLKGKLEPYLTSLSRDFPVVGLAVRFRSPADSPRTPYARELYLAGGLSLHGGGRLHANLRVPTLTRDHRLVASLAITRRARFLFAGLGNDSEFDQDRERGARAEYYSVRRHRAAVRVEGTRWLGGGVGIALGLGVEDATFAALPGETIFRDSIGDRLRETDATAGVTLVYDRRDSESIASRGVLLQTGAQLGTGAGSYHRVFGIAQGYLPVRRGTVVALRGAATTLGGDPPLVARYEIPAWERPIGIFGGDDSHRGFRGHRFIGEAAWLANLELRQDLGVVRGHTVSLIGFVDGGRVFEAESFRLGSDGVKVGGGLALAVRGVRERLGAGIGAIGPEGVRVSVMSAWAF